MLIQSGMPLLHSAPMPLQDCDDEGSFCWKVVMDASFPNLDGVGDVGITESGEASLHEQLMGDIHDPFGSIRAHVVSDYLLVGLVAKDF